jgi:hypothetical protein
VRQAPAAVLLALSLLVAAIFKGSLLGYVFPILRQMTNDTKFSLDCYPIVPAARSYLCCSLNVVPIQHLGACCCCTLRMHISPPLILASCLVR